MVGIRRCQTVTGKQKLKIGLSPNGKATDSDSVIVKVRILLAQLKSLLFSRRLFCGKAVKFACLRRFTICSYQTSLIAVLAGTFRISFDRRLIELLMRQFPDPFEKALH